MRVSFCVVARNEQEYLLKLLLDLCNQTYDHSKIEVILVDGNSSDNTKDLMMEFKRNHSEFYDVIILDNPKKILSAGWNLAIRHSTGDVIIRLDAHASMPAEFISKNMEYIASGEDICGGPRPNIIENGSSWKETLLIAESSLFGSSIAPYRKSNKKRYVKSLFHATYRHEVFEKIGLYNEALGRTEDNEIHYRMRKSGYKLCYHPDIISYQYTRNNLKGMLKQKFANGYWVGLTLGVCPKCFSIYHFIPLCFIIGIIVTTIFAICGFSLLFKMLWILYWLVAILMSLLCFYRGNFNATLFALPIIFFLLHVNYGVGTLIGIMKIPFWRKGKNVYPRIENKNIKNV